MVFFRRQVALSGKCANPYLFIFLNTFKYVSAHETITLINASIILKKEEYEYSTFPNKVRHHKVQHRDQQQRFRHTALMTEHDLAMLYEWLNRSHIVEWWGGEKHARHLLTLQEQYLPSVLAQRVRHSIHCNAEWRADWHAQSYVALEAGTDGGRRNRSRSTRNRPVRRMHHNWAKAWNQAGSSSG